MNAIITNNMNFIQSLLLFILAVVFFTFLGSVAVDKGDVVECHRIKTNIEHGYTPAQDEITRCAGLNVSL